MFALGLPYPFLKKQINVLEQSYQSLIVCTIHQTFLFYEIKTHTTNIIKIGIAIFCRPKVIECFNFSLNITFTFNNKTSLSNGKFLVGNASVW